MFRISLGGLALPRGTYRPNTFVLIKLLESKGCETTLEAGGEFFLAFDHEERSYQNFISHGGSIGRSILIRQETDAVYPGQYHSRVEKKYGLVMTLGGVDAIRCHDFLGHPYAHSSNPTYPTPNDLSFKDTLEKGKSSNLYAFSTWNLRPIFFSLVGANKVGLNSKGNYGIRRRFVNEFTPLGLEVYGILWNDGLKRRFINRVSMVLWGLKTYQFPPLWNMFSDLFKSYKGAKGEVPDKDLILSRSKFSLIVENTNNMITEKLFDSILSGSIPVYYGPNLPSLGLPKDIAIEIRESPVPIRELLTSLTDKEIERRLVAIQDFLESPTFQDEWLAESVYLKVFNLLERYMETN